MCQRPAASILSVYIRIKKYFGCRQMSLFVFEFKSFHRGGTKSNIPSISYLNTWARKGQMHTLYPTGENREFVSVKLYIGSIPNSLGK